MGESLVGKSFLQTLEYSEQFRLSPMLTSKVGGQSITDMGAKAVFPVVKEIADNAKKHKMIISTGRDRSDMYMPSPWSWNANRDIIQVGAECSEQNALMLTSLLSPCGGIKVGHDDIPKLAAYFAQGCIPIIHGMPPYGYWRCFPQKAHPSQPD
jgi:molybdenum storage protein